MYTYTPFWLKYSRAASASTFVAPSFAVEPTGGVSCYFLREDVQRGINMGDLPQTAPGVPCVGIDPNEKDLAGITTIAEAFKWLGTEEPARKSLLAALGAAEPRLRDLVYIKSKDYDDMLAQLIIPGAEGKDSRAPTPLEMGHYAQLRRICRLRMGLTAVEVVSTLPALGTVGFSQPSPMQGVETSLLSVLAAAKPAPVSTEPRLKLSVILDPTLDSELVRLPHHKIRDLFTAYEKLRGAEPVEDVEPTTEQISAVNQVLENDMVPYADFSLLGPHGRRLLGKLSYLSWTFQPDGSWTRRELPGPPGFDQWWASFRVLKVIYLMLEVAAPEILDNYGEMLRGFHTMYGSACWFIIYTADVRMRTEQFGRLRRRVERDHQVAVSMGAATTFDPAKPWRAVFAAAISVTEKLWWDENLHRPAMLFLTRIKSASESVADGTVQDVPEPIPAAPRGRSRSRGSPSDRREKRPQSSRDGAVFTKGGQQLCEAYNSSRGCFTKRCPDHHSCKKCRGHHSAADCRPKGKARLTPNNQSVPPPPQPPNRSKGEDRYKSKRGNGKNRY